MSKRREIKPIPKDALGISGIPIDSKQIVEPDSLQYTNYSNDPLYNERISNKLREIKETDERIKNIEKRTNESRERNAETEKQIAKIEAEMKATAEAKASTSSGGNKKDTYTVKELKTIASRNNIKTTKKLNGKTVPLNKKGLVAKLKRNKVI
jgi:septal ring factor EnvC (AmiA/AmiB activator)